MKKIRFANSKIGGGHLDTKAFTLIELLAIIVILAIIAVITVPIILNIIENSRKGAAVDSAYGYKDAISKYYVSELIDNQNLKLDGTYSVDNGSLKKDNETLQIPTSGDSPSVGWVKIKENEVTDYSLRFGDYVVTYNSNTDTMNVVKNGEIAANPNFLPKQIGAAVTNYGGYNWHVIKSDESSVTLLMDDGEYGSDLLPNLTDGKLRHCESDNCSSGYSWAASKIKDYLNDESEGSFLYNLKSEIDNNIIPARVCNNVILADRKTYPGYLESEIPDNSCANNIGSYAVRLLTHVELDDLIENILIEDKSSWLTIDTAQTMSGGYASWYGDALRMITIINSTYGSYYGSARYDYEVRPVITVEQNNIFTE